MFSKLASAYTGYKKYISSLWQKGDKSSLMDQLFLISLSLSLVFAGVYKIAIYLESLWFQSSNLVIHAQVKANFSFLLLACLLLWAFAKLILIDKPLKNSSSEDFAKKENSSFSLTLFGRNLSFNTKTLFSIAVVVVIALSIYIKVPYMQLPFAGSHPMKYNTYAEPALYMYERNDPLYFKRNYQYNPLKPSTESAKGFDNFPVMEWLLYAGYSTLGKVFEIETITRIVTAVLGAVGLYSLYLFLSTVINKKAALISILLLTFNPIFNLASYVTVYDIITFSLTFFSLYFVSKFIAKPTLVGSLAVAGLFAGIGASIKLNILVWLLPMVLVSLFLTSKRKNVENLSSFAYYLFWTVLPGVAVSFSLSHFPSKEPVYFVLFVVLLVLIGYLLSKAKLIYTSITNIVSGTLSYMNKNRYLYFVLLLVVVLGIMLLYKTSLATDFLTDFRLLINSDLYRRLLFDQYIPYVYLFPFAFFVLCLPLLLRLKGNLKRYVIAFFFGSLVYLVLASKAMFFHSYYWIVLIAFSYLVVALGILKLAYMVSDNTKVKTLFITLLTLSFVLLLWPQTAGKINRPDEYIGKVAEYFNSRDLPEGTSYIDTASTGYVLFKTDMKIVYGYEVFDTDEFRAKTEELGFVGAMEYFKIRFVVSPYLVPPAYTEFTNGVDFDETLDNYALRRTLKIYDDLYGYNEYHSDYGDRMRLVGKYKIDKSFKLVARFGTYDIYELDPTLGGEISK